MSNFRETIVKCCYTCKHIYRNGDIYACDLGNAVNREMNIRDSSARVVDYVQGWIGVTNIDAIFHVCDDWKVSKSLKSPMRTMHDMLIEEA